MQTKFPLKRLSAVLLLGLLAACSDNDSQDTAKPAASAPATEQSAADTTVTETTEVTTT